MKNTIIIYETHYGTSKKVANIFKSIIDRSKVYNIKSVPKNIQNYNNVIIVFSFHGYDTAWKIKKYVSSMKEVFTDKKILIIGVGLQQSNMDNYMKSLREAIGREEDYSEFVEGEIKVSKLTDQDVVILLKFCKKYNMEFKDMGEFNEKEVYDLALKYKNLL